MKSMAVGDSMGRKVTQGQEGGAAWEASTSPNSRQQDRNQQEGENAAAGLFEPASTKRRRMEQQQQGQPLTWSSFSEYMALKNQKLQEQVNMAAQSYLCTSYIMGYSSSSSPYATLLDAPMLQFESSSLQMVPQSSIFQGVSIFVNGYTQPSAQELKQIMLLHGGSYQAS